MTIPKAPSARRVQNENHSFLAAFLTVTTVSQATSITLGGGVGFRSATLDSAVAGSGHTGSGNATVTDIEGYYGGDWTERGSVESGSGSGLFSDGLLSVNVTSGQFGVNKASGTWTVSSSFWTTYGEGAISIHVGNGNGEPDHFAWKLTPGLLSGTWDYDGTPLRGGGLSNIKLYSTGTGTTVNPTNVPEGGSSIALLASSILGMLTFRRAFSQRKV